MIFTGRQRRKVNIYYFAEPPRKFIVYWYAPYIQVTQLADKKKLLYLRLYPDIWWKIRRFAIYSMDKCNYLKLVTIRVPKCFLFHWALFMSSKNAAKQIFHFQFYFPFILSLAQVMVIISARW